MNRRQRRRQRRRIAADPELYAQTWTVRAALVTLVLLLGTVAADTGADLTGVSHGLALITLVGAAVTVRLARHSFKLRLAHRHHDWSSGDPTLVIEDLADVFDVPDEFVKAPQVTQKQVQRAHVEHVLIPTMDEMANRITAALHREGTLPPDARLDYDHLDGPA